MYKIGEFAKLCNCTSKLIRFYDDIGLLKADYIDANSGYRYYNANKIEIFQKIILFREVGFTLKEITQELLFSSEEAILTALEKKEKELLNKYELCRKLKENYKELKTMENRIEFIKSVESDSIVVKAPGAQPLELFTDEKNIQPVIDALDMMLNVPGYINLDFADLLQMTESNNTYSINYTQLKLSGEYNNIPSSKIRAKCGIISLIAAPAVSLDDIDSVLSNIFHSIFHADAGLIFGTAFDNMLSGNEIQAAILELY